MMRLVDDDEPWIAVRAPSAATEPLHRDELRSDAGTGRGTSPGLEQRCRRDDERLLNIRGDGKGDVRFPKPRRVGDHRPARGVDEELGAGDRASLMRKEGDVADRER